MQNLPKRNKEAKQVIRTGLKPSPGCRLLEEDFSGAEVGTSAAYNKDPTLINYLWPEDEENAGDMHRDSAADIWCTTAANISKDVRFYVKNNWTFAQFYGDWFGSCAPALWEHRDEKLKDGTTCAESLRKRGITTLKQFIDHCEEAERILWKERFKVYDEWKASMQVHYQKNCTVSTFLGFTFRGYMDKKQVTNYNIQGTSFHLLLTVLLKMRTWLKENNMKTKILGQIHDSGIFDSPEDEFMLVHKQFSKYTNELYDLYEWMEVPLSADAEVSLLDGDFGHMFPLSNEEDFAETEQKYINEWKVAA